MDVREELKQGACSLSGAAYLHRLDGLEKNLSFEPQIYKSSAKTAASNGTRNNRKSRRAFKATPLPPRQASLLSRLGPQVLDTTILVSKLTGLRALASVQFTRDQCSMLYSIGMGSTLYRIQYKAIKRN
ncbi:hypothetical protein RHSIM_RhsimMtG0000900 (mitochondrion) [Rhododendron simsii]|uniref:Uncharacterized protein n=1 Tax=Rhododendron simsii TaxID=118357 RepID=A0A834L388_RHOSS|nr:hypothetical protein RHSIM_RhsimMtG0000900 [Rhododendron simsii]